MNTASYAGIRSDDALTEAAGGNIFASITLLLATAGKMPDEALLRRVIGRASLQLGPQPKHSSAN